jgi:N-terminal acetyltransferase B complex catalytic subunit
MGTLEDITEHMYYFYSVYKLIICSHKGYFVDLFVRISNSLAISMYKSFGYSVYRQVLGYYSGEEDALGIHCTIANHRANCISDMRKAMSRDVHKKSIIPLPHPVTPDEVD